MNDYSKEEFWLDLKSGKFASMVKDSAKGQIVSNSKEVYGILKPILAEHDDVEALYGIFLDAKNHVIRIEKLFSGSITGTTVYPREIIKKILTLKSTAILLAHNHPSGDPTPSAEDREITARIGLILHAMGVALHDHIIIGTGYHSMADSGWLRQVQNKFNEIITGIQSPKKGVSMTQEEKARYHDTDELRKILMQLKGRKYRLDCGHHATICHNLGNNITIYNGKNPKIICSLCSY